MSYLYQHVLHTITILFRSRSSLIFYFQNLSISIVYILRSWRQYLPFVPSHFLYQGLECSAFYFRDLPLYGQRQYQPYFARTFETYTKLWKFQQENRLKSVRNCWNLQFIENRIFRMVLDNVYGLKRWQIGEIASKIGQLYYHY